MFVYYNFTLLTISFTYVLVTLVRMCVCCLLAHSGRQSQVDLSTILAMLKKFRKDLKKGQLEALWNGTAVVLQYIKAVTGNYDECPLGCSPAGTSIRGKRSTLRRQTKIEIEVEMIAKRWKLR